MEKWKKKWIKNEKNPQKTKKEITCYKNINLLENANSWNYQRLWPELKDFNGRKGKEI